MPDLLDNYNQLVSRVDALCQGIAADLGGQITCSAGCSSCCIPITVFPVEAAAMRKELDTLPRQQADEIRRLVIEQSDTAHCPLLHHHICLLYAARPIICRTHGLPIIYTEHGQQQSDCCPRNLTGAETVSGSSVVNLDTLNTLLVAVNSIYLSQSGSSQLSERLTIAEIITNHFKLEI
jgi:uncharacterized protein